MSIKPIDMQVMLPKTSEVSKIHSAEAYKNQVQQQQQAETTQHRVENSMRQVYSQDRTYEARIKEREEKRQGRDKNDESKNKEKEKTKNDNEIGEVSSIIDIRI